MKFVFLFFLFFSFTHAARFWKIDFGTPIPVVGFSSTVLTSVNRYDSLDSMILGNGVVHNFSYFDTFRTGKRGALSHIQIEYYSISEKFSFTGDWGEANWLIGYTANKTEEYIRSLYNSNIENYEAEYGLGRGRFSLTNEDYYIGLPFYYENDTSVLLSAKLVNRKFQQKYLYNTSLFDDSAKFLFLNGSESLNNDLYYTTAYNRLFSRGLQTDAYLNYIMFGVEKTMINNLNKWKVTADFGRTGRTKGTFIGVGNSYSNVNQLAEVSGGQGTPTSSNRTSFISGGADLVGVQGKVGFKYILNQYAEFYIDYVQSRYYQLYRPNFSFELIKIIYSQNTVIKDELMTSFPNEFLIDTYIYSTPTVTDYIEYRFGVSFFI